MSGYRKKKKKKEEKERNKEKSKEARQAGEKITKRGKQKEGWEEKKGGQFRSILNQEKKKRKKERNPSKCPGRFFRACRCLGGRFW